VYTDSIGTEINDLG